MARIAKENVREKILEAAERRLWHYGIRKTTIDEVAADAGVGKGTVYLYFDSKEDIYLAIIVGYKQSVLREQEKIITDADMGCVDKIRQFLLCPVLAAQCKCETNPEAREIISVLKPHLAEHLRPYLEQEIRLLAQIIQQGIDTGEFAVTDTLGAARSLKMMTMGFFPPYPCVEGQEAAKSEINAIVNLATRGLSVFKLLPGTENAGNKLKLSAGEHAALIKPTLDLREGTDGI